MDLVEVKKKTKCMFCKKTLNKGDMADYSCGRGYACQSCQKNIEQDIEKELGKIPDTTCPLCKGTGKVSGLYNIF